MGVTNLQTEVVRTQREPGEQVGAADRQGRAVLVESSDLVALPAADLGVIH